MIQPKTRLYTIALLSLMLAAPQLAFSANERPDRPERPERPDRPDQPQRPDDPCRGPSPALIGADHALQLVGLMAGLSQGGPKIPECGTTTIGDNEIGVDFGEGCGEGLPAVCGAASVARTTDSDSSTLTLTLDGFCPPGRSPKDEVLPPISGTATIVESVNEATFSANGITDGELSVDGTLTIINNSLTSHTLEADFSGSTPDGDYSSSAMLTRSLTADGLVHTGSWSATLPDGTQVSGTVDIVREAGCRFPVGTVSVNGPEGEQTVVLACDGPMVDEVDAEPAPVPMCSLKRIDGLLNELAAKSILCPFCPTPKGQDPGGPGNGGERSERPDQPERPDRPDRPDQPI